jgi:hypothetical protein
VSTRCVLCQPTTIRLPLHGTHIGH